MVNYKIYTIFLWLHQKHHISYPKSTLVYYVFHLLTLHELVSTFLLSTLLHIAQNLALASFSLPHLGQIFLPDLLSSKGIGGLLLLLTLFPLAYVGNCLSQFGHTQRKLLNSLLSVSPSIWSIVKTRGLPCHIAGK